jgi:hypothetical protein
MEPAHSETRHCRVEPPASILVTRLSMSHLVPLLEFNHSEARYQLYQSLYCWPEVVPFGDSRAAQIWGCRREGAINPHQGVAGLHKMPTGIEGFDSITRGGLPRNRTTLVLGGPGLIFVR